MPGERINACWSTIERRKLSEIELEYTYNLQMPMCCDRRQMEPVLERPWRGTRDSISFSHVTNDGFPTLADHTS